jgi:protein phosphatase
MVFAQGFAPVTRARYPHGMEWESAILSDPGQVRKNNEDTPLVRSDLGLFAVADGMGGHAAGEVASQLAIQTLVECVTEAGAGLGAVVLVRAFDRANRTILDRSIDEPSTHGMGTTLTVLAINGRREGALLAHIGDSRLYRWRADRLDQLTRDHTWVQEHIDAGVLTPEQARNHPFASVLTRVLGTTATAAPDIERISVEPGDLFLLCSDGLTGMLEAEMIATILAADLPLDRTARLLIDAANGAGGADNITVVLARALPQP